MGKVPVWRTVGEGLGFAFGRYPAILGVVWLPLLLLGVAGYFTLLPFFGGLMQAIAHAAQHPHDPDVANEILASERFLPAFNLLSYLVMAWIAVGVTKEALGMRSGPRFVYLSVGMGELRLLGAYLVVFAMFIAAEIALLLVGVFVFAIGALIVKTTLAPADWAAWTPWAIGAAAVLCVAVLFALIYVTVRLMALLVPVTVAERRFGLIRSWELSKGNFWRLFGVGLLIFLVLVILELVLFAVLGGPVLVALIGSLHGHTHDPAAVGVFFRSLKPYLPVVGLVALAIAPLLYGLHLGPWAFAYKALVPDAGAPGTANPAGH